MENKTLPKKGKKKDPTSSYIVINNDYYLPRENPRILFGTVLESFSPYVKYSSKQALIKLYIDCLKILEDYCNTPEIKAVYRREGSVFIKSIQKRLIYVNKLKKKSGSILQIQTLFFDEILKSEGHTIYIKDRYINPPWSLRPMQEQVGSRNLIRIIIKNM